MKFKRPFTWTIPNVLTTIRILVVPVILVLILLPSHHAALAAFVLFVLTGITDTLDGYIARNYNMQSEFGAYWDPLADKILVTGLYILLIFIPGLFIYWWLVLLIILRDIAVTVMRNHFKNKGLSFKTSVVAKAKTTVQMIVLGTIVFYIYVSKTLAAFSKISYKRPDEIWQTLYPNAAKVIIYIPLALTIIAVIFTIYTGVDYFLVYLKNVKRKIK